MFTTSFLINVKVNFGQSNQVEQLIYACFQISLKSGNEKLFLVSITDKIWLQEGKQLAFCNMTGK